MHRVKAPAFPDVQIWCWPLCYDFNGFWISTSPQFLPFFYNLSVPHLTINLLMSDLYTCSFFWYIVFIHSCCLFLHRNPLCLSVGNPFFLLCLHGAEHKTATHQLCTSQTFFPRTGAKGLSIQTAACHSLSAQGQARSQRIWGKMENLVPC